MFDSWLKNSGQREICQGLSTKCFLDPYEIKAVLDSPLSEWQWRNWEKIVKIAVWVIEILSIESDSDCNQICAIFIESMCNRTLVQYKVSWQMAINMYLCNNYILLYFFIFWATAKGQTKKYSENLQPLNISKYNKRFSRFNVPEKSAKRPDIGMKMCNVPKI